MTPHKDGQPADKQLEALLKAAAADEPDLAADARPTGRNGGTKADAAQAGGKNNDGKKNKSDNGATGPRPQDGGAKPQDDGTREGDSTLKAFAEIVRERATEGDSKPNAATSLSSIINGDILNTDFMKKQIGVVLLITAFIIVYITNRYACQRHLQQIDKLTKELTDAKFRALSSNSELTEKSRESRVLDMLRQCNDSTLHIASQPPYIIPVPEDGN